MKKVIVVFVYAFTVMFFLYKISLGNAEQENLTRERDYFQDKSEEVQERMYDVSCVNIIMRGKMCKRCEKKLRLDTTYISIIDNLN